MHTLEETLALVERQRTSEASLIALMTSIKQRLDAALGGELTPSQQMRVDAIFNGVNANIGDVDAAVKANTEEAPPAEGDGTSQGGGQPAADLVETRTTVTSSLNPIEPGQTITLSGGVEGRPGGSDKALTGSITFKDGETVLGTANLDSTGVAALSSTEFAGGNLAAGNHSLTAEYSGDAVYAASTSDPLDQTVAGPNAG